MKFPVLWLSFACLWVGTEGPHHLNGCQNFNLLRQTNNKQKIISRAKCMKYFSLMVDVMRSWWSALDL